MPYIDVKMSVKLDDRQKEVLKAKLGEMISIIPGKREGVTMIGINDGYTLYFAGQNTEKIAFLEVRLFGESAFESKKEFTEKVFEFFEKEYGITGDNFFMNISEHKCWGVKGTLRRLD